MNELVAGILDALSENGAMRAVELAWYVASRLDLENDEAVVNSVEARLVSLQALGLVELVVK